MDTERSKYKLRDRKRGDNLIYFLGKRFIEIQIDSAYPY